MSSRGENGPLDLNTPRRKNHLHHPADDARSQHDAAYGQAAGRRICAVAALARNGSQTYRADGTGLSAPAVPDDPKVRHKDPMRLFHS